MKNIFKNENKTARKDKRATTKPTQPHDYKTIFSNLRAHLQAMLTEGDMEGKNIVQTVRVLINIEKMTNAQTRSAPQPKGCPHEPKIQGPEQQETIDHAKALLEEFAELKFGGQVREMPPPDLAMP